MVSVSLRQNRAGTPDQNSRSSIGPFDRANPPRYRAGARGPGSPLEFVPGNGFYDWAGRRLFLADGSPDPDTPGAYRYQHNPDCCDLETSEADPAHPRYEPEYLRHQPGDTWEIGGKPADPDDPGPFGSHGWYQDRRTGRHRRNELPDPLPPELESPQPQTTRPSPGLEGGSEADGRATRPGRYPASGSQPESASDADQRPSPSPRGQSHSRFWSEADSNHAPAEQRHRSESFQSEEPHRFDRLREDAWDHFMTDSAPLAAAHHDRPRGRSAIEREAGGAWALWIRLVQWLIALIKTLAAQQRETGTEPAAAAEAATAAGATEPVLDSAPGAARRPAPVKPRTGIPQATMARALSGARRARAEHSARVSGFAADWAQRCNTTRSTAQPTAGFLIGGAA